MGVWKFGILLLKFSLFEDQSHGSIINIFVYIFMWFIVLVIKFMKSCYKSSLNEEVDAACIYLSKQPSTNLV
jgi:hypothetical protein